MLDVQFLLDWAIDVGGDNYRPTMDECHDVLTSVLGDKVLYEIRKDAGKDWQDFNPMIDMMLRDGALVRVYPEVSE